MGDYLIGKALRRPERGQQSVYPFQPSDFLTCKNEVCCF